MLVMTKKTSGYGQTIATPVTPTSSSITDIWTSLGIWKYVIGGFAAWYVYKMFFQRTY
jgi:hypothetical protein